MANQYGTYGHRTEAQKAALRKAVSFTPSADEAAIQSGLQDQSEERSRYGVSARSSCNGFARGMEFDVWTRGGV